MRYTITHTLELDVEFKTLESLIQWLENATVFDLVDKGATTIDEVVRDDSGTKVYDITKGPRFQL